MMNEMDVATTPKFNRGRSRSKFVSPSPSSSYRSPLINKVASLDSKFKVKETDVNADVPIDVLKNTVKEMWDKNEELKKSIADLENQGYKEEQLQWYIDKLHEYNEIKDVAQMVMGKIALIEETTVRKVHEEFGMTDSD